MADQQKSVLELTLRIQFAGDPLADEDELKDVMLNVSRALIHEIKAGSGLSPQDGAVEYTEAFWIYRKGYGFPILKASWGELNSWHEVFVEDFT